MAFGLEKRAINSDHVQAPFHAVRAANSEKHSTTSTAQTHSLLLEPCRVLRMTCIGLRTQTHRRLAIL